VLQATIQGRGRPTAERRSAGAGVPGRFSESGRAAHSGRRSDYRRHRRERRAIGSGRSHRTRGARRAAVGQPSGPVHLGIHTSKSNIRSQNRTPAPAQTVLSLQKPVEGELPMPNLHNELISKSLTPGVGCFEFDRLRSIGRSLHRAPQAAAGSGRGMGAIPPEKRVVPPARLNNSPRLESLVRAGNLYLSVQDVIALVLENNLDIAVQRYSPLLAREVVRRTEGGGFLRQVDTPIFAGPTSVSTAGVSVNANGLAGGAGLGSGGGIVSQIGPVPPNLDPSLYASFSTGHLTTPLTNESFDQTSVLTNSYRQYIFQYAQQFITGTFAQLTFYDNRSLQNSPTPLFNPSITGFLDLQISQNLLQGFNIGVNNRDIRIAKNNMKVSNLQLKLQVA